MPWQIFGIISLDLMRRCFANFSSWCVLQDSVKDLGKDAALKPQMRTVFRAVNKIVAQIGGYEQQVKSPKLSVPELGH